MGKLETSERILENALQLFSSKGYASTTTKEIAEKAGVSEITLFRHFQTKRNLYASVFEKFLFKPEYDSIFTNLDGDPGTNLIKVGKALFRIFSKNKPLLNMEFKDVSPVDLSQSVMKRFPNELKDCLVGYLKDLKSQEIVIKEPELLAVTFLSSVFGLFMNLQVMELFDESFTFDDCLKKLVDGLIT